MRQTKRIKMKNIIFIGLILQSFLGFSQEIKLDTKKASVSFNFVSAKTKGTIDDINASIQFNSSDLGKSVITGSANVEALTTGNSGRDKHLKSEHYFDAKNFPTMKFTSTEISADGLNFTAKGTLTIKDVTKEVTFTVRMDGTSMVFETTIYTTDFGISVKKGREKNKVTVKVTVPLT